MSTASSITIPDGQNSVTLEITDPSYDPTDRATPSESTNISFSTDDDDPEEAAVSLIGESSLTLTDNADGLPLAGDYFAVDNGFDGGNTAADIISLVNPTTGDNVPGIAVLGPVPNDAKDRNLQYTVTNPGDSVANGVVAATLSIVYPADPEIVGTLSLTDTESDVRIWWLDQDRWVPASSLDLDDIKPGSYTVLIQGATAGADTVEATFTPNNGSADVSESDPVNVFSVGLTASNDQTFGTTTEGILPVDDGYGIGYTDGQGNPVADNVPGTTSGFFAGAEKLPASAATNDPLLVPATLTFSGPFPANETTWQISYNESDMAIWNANTMQLIVSGQNYPLAEGTTQIPLLYQGLAAGASLDRINASMTVFGDTGEGGSESEDDEVSPAVTPAAAPAAQAGRTNGAKDEQQVSQFKLNIDTIQDNQITGTLTPNELNVSGAYVPVYNRSLYSLDDVALLQFYNELLPFTITPTQVAGNVPEGTYTFNIPSNISVWMDSSLRRQVTNGMQLSGSVVDRHTFYICGQTQGVGTLTITWTPPAGRPVVKGVRVTTFDFVGPQIVPNYSDFTYSAQGELPSYSGFGSPVNGSASTTGQATQAILWNAVDAPRTGTVVFKASNNFQWDFAVSIVQVSVINSSLTYNATAVKSPVVLKSLVKPSIVGQMDVEASVEENGLFKGAPNPHITVGIIQNVTVDYYSAVYTNFSTLTPYYNGTPLAGQSFLDTLPGEAGPWYDSDAVGSLTSNFGTVSLVTEDRPSLGAPPRATDNKSLIEVVSIGLEFQTYVAVTTDYSAYNSKPVYTQIAVANWYASLSFYVAAINGIYYAIPYVIHCYTGGSSFESVTNGAQVPIVSGGVANNTLTKLIWKGGSWI